MPVVTVVAGDTPWDLAEHHLGHGLRWRQLWQLNRGVAQPDGRAWVTEDLIRPGWHLRLPANTTAIPETPASTAPNRMPARSGSTAAAPSPTADAAPSPRGNTHRCPFAGDDSTCDVHDTDASATPHQVVPATPRRGLTEDPAPPPPNTPGQTSGARDHTTSHDHRSPLPAPVGLASTIVGLMGAVVLIHRRRQTVGTARCGRPPLPSRKQPTAAATAAASDLSLERWAGHHFAALFADPPWPFDPRPVAVEISHDTGIELLWDTPNLVVPRPWTATDGGWAWHLPHDPDERVPLVDEPPGIPGLVTIGTRQGRQLLIDLEAFGSIALAGDSQRVADLARAITVELGAGDELSNAHVIVASVDVVGTDQLCRARIATTASALEELRNAARSISGGPERSGSPSTGRYHRTSQGRTDVTVIMAPADAAATSLIEAAPSRRGVATILVGSAPNAAAQITVNQDGTAELEPLRIKFQAAARSASSAAGITDGLYGLDQPIRVVAADQQLLVPSSYADVGERVPRQEPDATAAAMTHLSAEPSHEDPDHDGSVDEPTWPEILVKVLGRPHVPARPNLRRRELALVVYLASKGKPTPAGSVQHAVWGGRSVQTKTIWNVATATRAALGQLADGRPAMPSSQRAHNTLAVASEVRTDLQVLEDLYDAAQHAPSSRAIDLLARGLDLIDGQPFDSPDYEWAHHTELLVAQANRLIEETVELLVDLASTAGRTDLARHAITQGLRALPGNEVLYRTRMTLEHGQDNLAAVHTTYTELETYLTGIDTEPSPATTDLYRRLRTRPHRHAS